MIILLNKLIYIYKEGKQHGRSNNNKKKKFIWEGKLKTVKKKIIIIKKILDLTLNKMLAKTFSTLRGMFGMHLKGLKIRLTFKKIV
jgi:hypothetical protein